MRVCRAHRGNVIGVEQTRFQIGDLTVELQPMHIEEGPRQLDLIHMLGIKQPLIGEVVHGKDRFSRTSTRFQIGAG